MTPDQIVAEDAAAEHGECLRDGEWTPAEDWQPAQAAYEQWLYGGEP